MRLKIMRHLDLLQLGNRYAANYSILPKIATNRSPLRG